MHRSVTASPILLIMVSAALLGSMRAIGHAADGKSANTPPAAAIAVVDFDYVDTSGEERDQRREHAARLNSFMAALRSDLAAQGKTIVAPKCDPAPCLTSLPVDDLLRKAREAGAGILLVGGFHKVSTLIQWARASAIDTATGQVVADKLYTFRGDNDEVWRNAEGFVVRDLARM